MRGGFVEEIGWVGVQGKIRVILSSGPGGLACRLYGGYINNLGRLLLFKNIV